MARDQRPTAPLRSGIIGAALAVACGLALRFLPVHEGKEVKMLGDGLMRASYDRTILALPEVRIDDLCLVLIDRESVEAAGQKWGGKEAYDRNKHAELLDQLRRDQCRLAVFDVHFALPIEPATDARLERALREHGRVALAADLDSDEVPAVGQHPGSTGVKISPPLARFEQATGTNWGVARVARDGDGVVRSHYPGPELEPSLHWAAAFLAGAAVTTNGSSRANARWLRYYGPAGKIPSFRYREVLGQFPGFFRDKTVFVGSLDDPGYPGEKRDSFSTPFTLHAADEPMAGVEIVATMFLNLRRRDWLERPPAGIEALLLTLAGAAFGFGLGRLRPLGGTLAALGGFALVAVVGLTLPQWTNLWFPWLLVGAGQIPCAWAWALLAHTQRLAREKAVLEKKVSRATPTRETAPMPPADGVPVIPDHALLRSIGKGAYGEVWLARNPVGLYHAVKIVFEREFRQAGPYEREFDGIRKFMPVSLEHAALVRVLHVGRNDAAAYFYYVMELGDDQAGGAEVDPVSYKAKTIESERRRRGRFPVEECVKTGLGLCDGLGFLHERRLVHRDIKPSNIIYVKGAPKLADIGLVTDLRDDDESRTFLGTPGYVAPEGPGTAAGDVYGLGKVLYLMLTGHDPGKFPELPADIGDRSDVPALFRLNDIILKACDLNLRVRYKSVAALRADLLALREHLSRQPAK